MRAPGKNWPRSRKIRPKLLPSFTSLSLRRTSGNWREPTTERLNLPPGCRSRVITTPRPSGLYETASSPRRSASIRFADGEIMCLTVTGMRREKSIVFFVVDAGKVDARLNSWDR